MRADLGRIYDETLTVVHRVGAKESGQASDAFQKFACRGCMWSETSQRTVSADGTVAIGTVRKVQVPETSAPEGFAVSAGDYVVRGEVPEEIDASNVRRVMASYEPNVFQVQHHRDLSKNDGLSHSTAGALRFAESHYMEG